LLCHFTEVVRVARVLIVDDEIQVAKALRRLLVRHGFEAEIATSAEEGLERLTAFGPDIVVSDYRMPGMRGPQFLDEVKRRAPATACFLVSGQVDLATTEPGRSAYPILPKPWEGDEVLRLLRGEAW
jgi:two-component system, OmpR family, response regulator VicR